MEMYRKSLWLDGMLLHIFHILTQTEIILVQLSLPFMMVIDGITMDEKTFGNGRPEMIGMDVAS